MNYKIRAINTGRDIIAGEFKKEDDTIHTSKEDIAFAWVAYNPLRNELVVTLREEPEGVELSKSGDIWIK